MLSTRPQADGQPMRALRPGTLRSRTCIYSLRMYVHFTHGRLDCLDKLHLNHNYYSMCETAVSTDRPAAPLNLTNGFRIAIEPFRRTDLAFEDRPERSESVSGGLSLPSLAGMGLEYIPHGRSNDVPPRSRLKGVC